MLDLFSRIISDEENITLSNPPAEKEFFEALSSLGSTKAPGPDGFTALFYMKYWNLVKKDVLIYIKHYFLQNRLHDGHNHSFIALVHKLSGSHTEFQPISLCNIAYKIISKILANRLKILIPKIISPL